MKVIEEKVKLRNKYESKIDYKAKYNSNAKTKHLIPVDLSKSDLAKISGIAQEAHKIIGCKGVTRSDFKFFKGKFRHCFTLTKY